MQLALPSPSLEQAVAWLLRPVNGVFVAAAIALVGVTIGLNPVALLTSGTVCTGMYQPGQPLAIRG
jgi:hypothetical protein